MNVSSGEMRARARAALRSRWGTSIAVSLVAALLGAGSSNSSFNFSFVRDRIWPNRSGSFSWRDFQNGFGGAFGNTSELKTALMGIVGIIVLAALAVSVALFIAGSAILLGRCLYYTRLQRAEPAPFRTLFDRFNIFGKAVGLRFFTAFFIFLWTLLLIVPGIIAAFRYAMAPYLMAEHPEMGIREAVNISKRMMHGHKADLFVLYLSFIGWAILASLSCGIGWLWLNPYIQAAEAEFYLEVSYQRPEVAFGPQPGGFAGPNGSYT